MRVDKTFNGLTLKNLLKIDGGGGLRWQAKTEDGMILVISYNLGSIEIGSGVDCIEASRNQYEVFYFAGSEAEKDLSDDDLLGIMDWDIALDKI